MATSTHVRGIQAIHVRDPSYRPVSLKSYPRALNNESMSTGRVPFSAIRNSSMPAPTSSSGIIKPIPITEKRQSSIISLGSILPRRKSLQTTALATRRQSLWMNLSKNPTSSTNPPPLLFPLAQDHSSLLRKKILRLLLVFSYLLSISIFGIALATFYGLFWSGYSSSQPTNILDIRITTPSSSSSSSFPSNKTSQTEHVS
ncbi:unnamed protein product [Adineta ricciae]|uniref:Uncharacterized protein n=1 Tax=Adineta ricciae TaxID=249248 RepID=A0A814T9B1_ADIRI|nr:unnamed protein product [Adineta ricciae]